MLVQLASVVEKIIIDINQINFVMNSALMDSIIIEKDMFVQHVIHYVIHAMEVHKPIAHPVYFL
jgi:hypothetical protein